MFQALIEAHRRGRLFADPSTSALDRRFDGPPPPYRSRPSTPVNRRRPTEVTTRDSPELLRRLEENARRLPFLWKEYWDAEFEALPQKEKQRVISEGAALRKSMEERERREKEAIDRFFTTAPPGGYPDGWFAVPKNKKQPPARRVSPNFNHPTPTETRKRKRETENNTEALTPSNSRKPAPGSRASKRARTRGADMQLNSTHHAKSQDEPVQHSVRSDETVPSAKPAAEPPSAPLNSSPKRARKPRTAHPAIKAKPQIKIPVRRSARITAMRSRNTEPSKPIKSSKGGKNMKTK